MKNKPLKWGIVSTARIAKNAIVPAIQASKLGKVAAVASRSLSKAEEFAHALGIPKAYGSYVELLQDPDIDAVYIPLPNDMHKAWAVQAAYAGKHVLCEKPIAMNAQECREMVTAAEDNHIQLMEGFMYRYHPRFSKMIEMLRAGNIGELRMIRTAFTFNISYPNDFRHIPEMGGGALMDVGCYCLNISRQIAGREPVSVQAQMYKGNTGIDLQLIASMDFGDNLFAQFDCAFNTTPRQECHIAGTQGTLDIPKPFVTNSERCQIIVNTEEDQKTINVKGANEYQKMIEHFARCVWGDETPLFPLKDAIANMQVIDALFESARDNGEPVRLL